jgi:hypothetical protein
MESLTVTADEEESVAVGEFANPEKLMFVTLLKLRKC